MAISNQGFHSEHLNLILFSFLFMFLLKFRSFPVFVLIPWTGSEPCCERGLRCVRHISSYWIEVSERSDEVIFELQKDVMIWTELKENSARGGCAGLGWVDVRTGWNPDATSKSSFFRGEKREKETSMILQKIEEAPCIKHKCSDICTWRCICLISVCSAECSGSVYKDCVIWSTHSRFPELMTAQLFSSLTSMRLQLISKKNKCDWLYHYLCNLTLSIRNLNLFSFMYYCHIIR